MYELFFKFIRVSWTENILRRNIFISVTVRHKNVQSNVLVRHIMISLYCWHSNVTKLIEIKISSELSLNSFEIIYFKRSTSMILLLFSYMNCTYEKISHTLILPWKFLQAIEMLTIKITYLQKTKWKNYYNFVSPKLLHLKLELNLFFGYPNQTQLLHNSFFSYPNTNGNKL